MIDFACISPHPPLLLPEVGNQEDRQKVMATQKALEKLANQLAEINPGLIIVSSPHLDWGISVPLHFLTAKLKPESYAVQTIITGLESTQTHYDQGRKLGQNLITPRKVAWIASGDLSHKLKNDGPYGFNPSGPKFDARLIELLQAKKVKEILNLNPDFVECAGECGLRSICFALGALEGAGADWQPEILSYEAPFGVGYLVAKLK